MPPLDWIRRCADFEAPLAQAEPDTGEAAQGEADSEPSESPFSDQDPNSASIRIDLSGIRTHNQENPSNQ